MKKIYAVFLIPVLCALCSPSFADGVQTKVQRNVSRAQLAKSSRAQLTFEWKKELWLSDMVHRRRPGFKDVVVKVENKTTECAGVLLNNSRVATPASCAKGKDGYKLAKVTVTLSNGKRGFGTQNSVVTKGDIAQVRLQSSLTQGLTGADVSFVMGKTSLQDAYGEHVSSALTQFLLSHGVVSARASRLSGRKNTLKKGEPFFLNGKLVALVNNVPHRLPVSLFGGLSEDFLAVFRR